MAPIRRITAKSLYEQASKDPAGVFKYEEIKPKDSKTTWRSGYMKNKFGVMMSPTDEKPIEINAIIENTDFRVVSPPSDPNDEKSMHCTFNKDNEKPKTELRISISGNHSGHYVDLIRLFQKERDERIPKMVADKLLSIGWKNQKNNSMIKEEYGEHAKDRAGQHYKDPQDPTKDDVRIPLILDFSINAQNSKENKGLPKTLIYDARTFRVIKDEKGEPLRIEYDLAMVEGQPINMNNCYKFITNGSEFIECDISIDTTSKSGQGISTKQVVKRVVVNPKEQTYFTEAPKNLDMLSRLQKLRGGSSTTTSVPAVSSAPITSVPAVSSAPITSDSTNVMSSVSSVTSNNTNNTTMTTNNIDSINNLLSGLNA